MSSQNISLPEGYFTPSVVNRHYSGNLIYTAIVYGDEPDEIFLLIDDTKFFLTKIDQTYLDGAIKITYQLEIDAQTLISRLTEDDVYRIFIGYLDIYQNGLRTVRCNVFLQVWDETIPLVEVKETVNGLFFTQNIVNVISDNALTAFEAVRTVYNDFTDDYDYICLVDVPGFFANSSFTMVSNDVQGIGRPIYNSSTNWGSEGRLKGIVKIALPNLFDEANYILLHEIGHSWINYLENTPYEIAIFIGPLVIKVRALWVFLLEANMVQEGNGHLILT